MRYTTRIVLSILSSLALCGALLSDYLPASINHEIGKISRPATVLSISPASQFKLRGEAFYFSVRMDAGENQLVGLDLVINFNPSALEIVSVQMGSGITALDQEIRNEIDNTNGKISYRAFTHDSSKAVKGTDIQVLSSQSR